MRHRDYQYWEISMQMMNDEVVSPHFPTRHRCLKYALKSLVVGCGWDEVSINPTTNIVRCVCSQTTPSVP